MIEVKGLNKENHGVLTFDGKVIEIFGFGHKHVSIRIHIDQVNLLMKGDNNLSIAFESGMIAISFTEGCENIDEFTDAIISHATNPNFTVK